MRHLLIYYKADSKGLGFCTTRCGKQQVPFNDCTVWWRDVTCPDCVPPPLPPPDQKRRRLVKVADA